MKKQVVFLCISLFAFAPTMVGQLCLPYFENDILQSNFLNPAHIPSCKVNIGIPVLNSISIGAAHNGFTFNDLFIENENNVLTPDLQNVVKKTGYLNYVSNNTDISLLFLGIKKRNKYFNFAIRERILADIFYNNDMLNLIINGNSPFEGETASLKGTGVNLSYFRQYSLGFAKSENEFFSWGGHLNLLFGKANMILYTGVTNLYTDPQTYILNATANANYSSSMPFIITNNTNFFVQQMNVSPSGFLLNRKNKGISFDAGFNYNYTGDTKIYGSILDLGIIRFKSNTTNLNANGNFEYTGPTLNEQDLTGYYSEMINSVDDSVDLNLDHDPYFYFMPTRLFLGFNHNNTRKLTTGVLGNSTLYRQKIKLYLGLHATYRLNNHIAAMASWSYANRSIKNIGGGFSFYLKLLNFYIISDNIPGFIWPRSTKSLNLQFGFNLRFGCNNKNNEGSAGCKWFNYPKSYQDRIK